MEDFFRQNLASLSGSEVKVLIAKMLAPLASTAELMRLSGITHRQTFYRTLHTLQARFGSEMLPTLSQNRTDMTANPNSVSQNRTEDVAKTNQVSQIRTEPVTFPNQDDVSLDFETALEAADGMPSDGDYRITTSNFMLRRKQQLQLLREAWGDLFGKEASTDVLKELLQLSHGQSITIYYAMQKAADRKVEFPRGYIKKILQATPAKPEPAQEELIPVTEEMRRQWDENEKLLAGYMSGWEG